MNYSLELYDNYLPIVEIDYQKYLIDTTLKKSISFDENNTQITIDGNTYPLTYSQNVNSMFMDLNGVIGLDILKRTSLTVFDNSICFNVEEYHCSSEFDFVIKSGRIIIECNIEGTDARVCFNSISRHDYISSFYLEDNDFTNEYIYKNIDIINNNNDNIAFLYHDNEQDKLMRKLLVDAIIGLYRIQEPKYPEYYRSKFAKFFILDFKNNKFKLL